MFKSTSTSATTIAQHAINAFNLFNEFQVEVKSESWGVMVTVLTGDNAGVYDYSAFNNSFIAA